MCRPSPAAGPSLCLRDEDAGSWPATAGGGSGGYPPPTSSCFAVPCRQCSTSAVALAVISSPWPGEGCGGWRSTSPFLRYALRDGDRSRAGALRAGRVVTASLQGVLALIQRRGALGHDFCDQVV